MDAMQACTKCGETKALEAFAICKTKKNGRGSWCKQCMCEWAKWNRETNTEKVNAAKRLAHIANREKDLERQRRWKAANEQKKRDADKRYREANPDRVRGAKRAWLENNRDRHRANCKAANERRKNRPDVRLHSRMSRAMAHALRGQKAGRSWRLMVPYSVDDLKRHLERRFLPGMTWGNMGEWHIDHIVPKVAFNFEGVDDIDFQRCWALSNLRPLWATDNHRKHAKLPHPFQPALALATGIPRS